MSKKKKQYYIKLPGSHKQRNRARNLLKCEVLPDGWNIYGGDQPHKVVQIGTELACDCDVYNREEKLCSHVIKVLMELGKFPTEPILVIK